MSKIIRFLLAFAIFFTPLNYGLANDQELTFFEALENMAQLGSYRIQEGFFGDFMVDDNDMKLKGEFRLNFIGAAKYSEAYQGSSDLRVHGMLKLNYAGGLPDEKPFEELTANVRGRLVSVFEDGVYLKLDDFNVKATELDEMDQMDLDEMMQEINRMKGVWFYIPMQVLMEGQSGYAELEGLYGETIDAEVLTERLKEHGFKGFFQDLFDSMIEQELEEGWMTEEEAVDAKIVLNRILNAKLFVKKESRGEEVGFHSFRFDKPALIGLIKDIGEDIDEPMAVSDFNDFRRALAKFDLFGLYHINSEYRLADAFALNFQIKNVEELKYLNLGFRYKISGINMVEDIEAPTDYVEIEAEQLPYPFYQPNYEDMDFENEEWLEEIEVPDADL